MNKDNPHHYGLPHDAFRPRQREAIEWATSGSGFKILDAPTGCHAPEQLVWLTNGYLKAVQDMQMNDLLVGPDGKPRRVKSLIRGFSNIMMKVVPSNGKPFIVTPDHILTLLENENNVLVDICVRDLIQDQNYQNLYKLQRVPFRDKVPYRTTTNFHIEPSPSSEYFGFTLTGDGRYLLDDLTITHNSGKTAIATAMAQFDPTISLVKTKSLQQDNYDIAYKWFILYGMANYDCGSSDAPKGTNTEDCPFTPPGKGICPLPNVCEYYRRKKIAQSHPRVSLNYPYFLLSKWTKPNSDGSQFHKNLALDEAHQLPDIVTEFAGMTITVKNLYDYALPQFPTIESSDYIMQNRHITKVQEWINRANDIMTNWVDALSSKVQANPHDRNLNRRLRSATRLQSKLIQTYYATSTPHYWYIEITSEKMVVKPLTARFHFGRYFNGFNKTLLMSATFGDIESFTQELGLSEYDYHAIPNQWLPESRPIYVLDCPRMGYKTTQKTNGANFKHQAEAVATAIKKYPSDWYGILHVTRIAEATKVADRLASHGLGHRMWIPPTSLGTEEQTAAWEQHKLSHPGAIAVTWSWYEGVDLRQERICGVLKIPFVDLSDPFEKARMQYSRKTYMWRTANRLEQSLGRTRRGEAEDYNLNGKEEQLVFIADGDYSRIKSNLSENILSAIQKP